jgi:molecular chaperone Hsp33
MTDAVTPFLFEHRNVRGAWVEIGAGVAEMLGHRDYSPDVRSLVGESCAAVALLAAQTAFAGRLSLQFQRGRGAVKLLVAQSDELLNVRGMAKADAGASGSLDDLMQGGVLGLTIEGGRGGQDYQALVEARGPSLAAALEGYFRQSEQLPTRLCLAGTAERLVGLLIQRLPARDPGSRSGTEDDASWDHLQALFNTLSPGELGAGEPRELMLQLFPDEDVRVFRPKPVQLVCRCSHASISAMLVSLGRQELEQILAERGVVEVTCEFCGKVYRYTPVEMQDLFAAIEAQADAATRH